LELRGFLGLAPVVRKGYQQIRLTLRIKAAVTDREFQELASLGPNFSPVFGSINKGVQISVSSERIALASAQTAMLAPQVRNTIYSRSGGVTLAIQES
jgi:hypothetical protein